MVHSICQYLNNKNKRVVRQKIRAYRAFARVGNSQAANKLYTFLRTCDVIPPVRFLNITISSEIIGEYLSYKLFNLKLTDNLYSSMSQPDVYSLPNNLPGAWRDSLKKQYQIKSGRLSFLRWRIFGVIQIVHCLAYGLLVIAGILRIKKRDAASGIYLHGLTAANLSNRPCENSYTIVNYFKTLRSTETIFFNINKINFPQRNLSNPVFSPFDFINVRHAPSVIVFILGLFATSVISVVLGKGLLAAFSAEILKIKLARALDTRSICREYAFYNSWSVYRPAWTYPLEQRGALISLYFYSMNCLPVNIDGKLLDTQFAYVRMSWTNFIVWNAAIIPFLRRNTRSNPTFEVTVPITFSDNNAPVPSMQNKLVVFDVTPVRYALFYQFAPLTNYYSANTPNNFYNDIVEIAKELGIEIVFKRKRSFFTYSSKRYTTLIERLEKIDFIEFADPDISAHRLIRDCRAVVSMPFTSTAHIGTYFNKPSIYYDGTGRITNCEPAALGLPMISKKAELKRWLKSIQ